MDNLIFYYKTESDAQKDSHILLIKAAKQLYGDKNYELFRRSGGKLYFKYHPEIHFSISHSGEYWTCAFSDAEVGLDVQIEEHHHRIEKISRRFFTLEEQEYLERCNYDEFYDIWAAKEAYLKYTGEGLARGLQTVSMVKDGQIAEIIGNENMGDGSPGRVGYLQKVDFQIGYHMWVCTDPSNGSIKIRKKELI